MELRPGRAALWVGDPMAQAIEQPGCHAPSPWRATPSSFRCPPAAREPIAPRTTTSLRPRFGARLPRQALSTAADQPARARQLGHTRAAWCCATRTTVWRTREARPSTAMDLLITSCPVGCAYPVAGFHFLPTRSSRARQPAGPTRHRSRFSLAAASYSSCRQAWAPYVRDFNREETQNSGERSTERWCLFFLVPVGCIAHDGHEQEGKDC
jgi:hypothetical protein